VTVTAAERIARILEILAWVRAHPGTDKASVAARFGISLRQLDDDLLLAWTTELPGRPDTMVDLEYLDSDRVTVIDGQGLDRPLRLRPDEAVALLVGLRTLASVPGLQERAALDSALVKIEEAVGTALPAADEPPPAGRLSRRVASMEATSATVRDALARGVRMRLRYWTPTRDEVSERLVDPIRIVTVDQATYLQAWCHDNDALRSFRIDRIVSVEVTDQPATPPRIDVDQAPEFTAGSDDVVAVLDLDEGARWLPEYRPCESVIELPDGRLRVTIRSGDIRWLERLVLRLGGEAHVVEPPELARLVQASARAALAAYG
jgi:proteasome accessory factor C